MLDGLGKLVQLGFIEGAAGVGGGLVDGVDGEELECAADPAWLLSLSGCTALGLWSGRAFPSAPGRERVRRVGVLLPLEGFGEALQSQVVVPHLGESLVLLVQADEVDVVAVGR